MNNEDIIGRLRIVIHLGADGFIDTTTNTIAADGGFKDFFRDNNSKAATVAHVGSKN